MGLRTFLRIDPFAQLKKTTNTLGAYGNFTLVTRGIATLEVQTERHSLLTDFYVVEDRGQELPAILGLPTCLTLGIISRIDGLAIEKPFSAGKELFSEFEDVFTGLGQMPGEHRIVLDKHIVPVVHPPRRVPLTIEPKLKEHLDKMEQEGIISKRSEPTDWVSSLLITEKKDGTLRICLDPRDLNRAIKREHFHIPTCDDILMKLSGKKLFTIIDMKDGFWQIKLDKESSKLCTFNTPFGRYSMNRLPFGISSAPEVFQKKTLELFGDVPGVHIVFDDMIVATSDEGDHDRALREILTRAREVGVKFNRRKIQYKVPEVSYLGHILTDSGVRPDDSKTRAIVEMPKPKDKTELQRLLGMITYLGKFIPNLSKKTDALRKLLKKEVAWHWTPAHDEAIDSLKQSIASATQLAFYDPGKQTVIQTDASGTGLGSCLMQDGKPIAFASRRLTIAETNYAQIEKELLAIVFACERFDLYIYGKPTLIHSDHKPLESVFKKPIHATTPRLQRMLLRLMRYNITVEYLPGKNMLVADALSRAYIDTSDGTTDEISEDIEVMVHTLLRNTPASNNLLDELRNATLIDPTLSKLAKFLKEGFPADRSCLNPELKQYYKTQSDIYELHGILFIHGKLIIPQDYRHRMLARIHEGHLGIEKCKNLAHTCMYWPGLANDIERFVGKCGVCNSFLRTPQRETLLPHPIPERPWQKVGLDIFQLHGRDYLLLVDYYSKFPETYRLLGKTAEDVILGMKSIFSRHGIPDEIIADNMPCNSQALHSFSRDWGFRINTSSPKYPQSNGMAERAIQTVKRLLQKAQMDRSDPNLALLQYRNAPVSGMEYSPAQLLMSRTLRSKLPTSDKHLSPRVVNAQESLLKRQQKQKFYFDQHAKDLRPLSPGECVRVKHEGLWQRASVQAKHNNPRSYLVQTENGTVLRRNRRHLVATREDTPDHQHPGTVAVEPEDTNVIEPELEAPGHETGTSGQPVTLITSPPTTRSGRRINPPARFADYDLKGEV